MKTKTFFTLLLVSYLGFQNLNAQRLFKKIQSSVEDLEKQINTLSKDEITELDQVAFKIKRIANNNGTVIFIDKANLENSQLAMIWLNTAFKNYEIPINVESAGILVLNRKSIPDVSSLERYGFQIKKTDQNQMLVKYSRKNSWSIYAKSIDDTKQTDNDTIFIIVDDSKIDKNKNILKLDALDKDKLPLKMVYLAAQINHLNKN